MKDYRKKLNKPFRKEIISQIKREVKKDFSKIKGKELNHFCNNVYVYAMLVACDVDKQEIAEYILYLNNKYVDQNKIVEDNELNCTNISYLKKLYKKYIKIIKERI